MADDEADNAAADDDNGDAGDAATERLISCEAESGEDISCWEAAV